MTLSEASAASVDRSILIKAARQLLSSVTRVLLLADRVLVNQILKSEDKACFSHAFRFLNSVHVIWFRWPTLLPG